MSEELTFEQELNGETTEPSEEPAAEETAENSTPEAGGEMPNEAAGESEEAEGAAEKPEQTPEERARFADLDRKQKLEQERETNRALKEQQEELLAAIAAMGIEAESPEDAVNKMLFMKTEYERKAKLAEMEQEAEETGVPLEVLRAQEGERRAQEEAQRVLEMAQQERAMAVFEADKVIVSTIDPKFFESASEQQLKAFGAMRMSGMDAVAALATVKNIPSQKQDPGTGHLVPASGGSGGGVDIPKEVLRDYQEMGYTKEQAVKDYKRQVKKGR